MTKKVDKDENFMKNEWGTQYLSSEYGWETKISSKNDQKSILREIVNDNFELKKHNLIDQTVLHEKIRNDEDYDDWEYGTEPQYGKKPE